MFEAILINWTKKGYFVRFNLSRILLILSLEMPNISSMRCLQLLNALSYSAHFMALPLACLAANILFESRCFVFVFKHRHQLTDIKRFPSSRTLFFYPHLSFSKRGNKTHFQKVLSSYLQGKTLSPPS